ncbi:MAG TPA: hypothetical protein VFR48_10650 [Solirubrobacteraceae bacterium]|nr:hypothetical protein [Solirubrobacteraceae bacterium]
MSRFQERLWDELVREHATALACPTGSRDLVPRLTIVEPRPAARLRTGALRSRGLSLRPRRLVVGLAALAAIVATVSILTTTGTTPSAAYAVTQNADGTVTVTIDELLGIAGANSQLEKLGVRATVIPVQAGCSASGQIVPYPPPLFGRLTHPSGQGVAIRPDLIPAGETLVLAARRIGIAIGMTSALYRGPVPSCVAPGDAHVG